jgi:hypothetical protein
MSSSLSLVLSAVRPAAAPSQTTVAASRTLELVSGLPLRLDAVVHSTALRTLAKDDR